MNYIKIPFIVISLLLSKSLFANVMLFDFRYDYLSGESLAGTFIGDLQADNDTILAITDFEALYSGAPLTLLDILASDIATISGGSPFDLTSVSPREGLAGFELTAGGRATIQDGEAISTTFENELFSGDRWRVSYKAVDVPEPNMLLLTLFGMLALYTRESCLQNTKN
jgi:hypothetical protein